MYSYKDFLSKKINYSRYLYEQELKIRQQAGNKFTPTVTIYTVIITSWITLFSSTIKSINVQCLVLSDIILFVALFSVIILLIISIIYFVNCFMNYKENVIEPEQLSKLFNDSESLMGEYEIDEVINNIDNIVANSYIECAIHNFKQTTEKIRLLNKSYMLLLISIINLFIAFLVAVIC